MVAIDDAKGGEPMKVDPGESSITHIRKQFELIESVPLKDIVLMKEDVFERRVECSRLRRFLK